ncbi:MAG: tRNA (adenosine(37)-N6)-threonylcarbamoyltransferase complex ATPase subunit type 1 TsaE [Clostridiaceae bacterium]|nr:tRNA (adenosine(37)-N6)-threonylcarbamoyltransferase complex ATPase subunit type 1 TsaE [Clostridiaceae bacterium]
MQEKFYQTNSVKETYLFGEALGRCLVAGDILALAGELGAGKTTITHGIAQGLGITSPISSPTFTLLFEHPAGTKNLPLFHFDAYRIADEAEWYDAGFMEYFDNQGVVIIEWADKIKNVLPQTAKWLYITTDIAQPDQRVFRLSLEHNANFNWKNLIPWAITQESFMENRNGTDN